MAREIIFFGDNVIDFYKSQDSKVQLKTEYLKQKENEKR